jgi:serine protease Do
MEMRGFSAICSGLSLFLLTFVLIPAAAAQNAVVHCYEEDRAVVQPRMADDCKGKVVSEAEAKRIKVKLRRERMKRAMKPKSKRHQGRRGHGTGFFVTAGGMVVTNHHVINACKSVIWIDTTDGQEGVATVVGKDKANDLALLKTTLKAPAIAVFRNPVDIGHGGEISVIGYGTHKLAPIRPKLVPGTFDAPSQNGTRLKMAVAVRPGNSGGPVLDTSGHVIGVVYAQLNTPAVFKKRGELILDLGFAISNPIALRFLKRHNVDYKTTTTSKPRPRNVIFKEAKPFIARVSCPR